MLMLPELIVILTAFLVLILDLIFLNYRKQWPLGVALLGLAAACMSTLSLMGTESSLLGGRFAIDALGQWFKVIFILATFLTLSFGMEPFQLRSKNPMGSRAEYIVVMLFTLSLVPAMM